MQYENATLQGGRLRDGKLMVSSVLLTILFASCSDGSAGPTGPNPGVLTAPIIMTASLQAGVTGTGYAAGLEATGGDGNYTWAISTGALPQGLDLVPSTGAITGTPTTAGTFNFNAQVTSGDGQTAEKALLILITQGGPSSSALYPNEPSGTTVLARWDGTSKTLTGWGTWGSQIEIVDDPSNPGGSGKVLQFNYGIGDVMADGPKTAQTLGAFNEYYIMFRIFYDPVWEAIGHKNFFWGANEGSRHNTSSPTQFFTTFQADGETILSQQNVSPSSNLLSIPGAMSLGEWMNMEIHVVAESSPGAGDGQVYYYINDVLLSSNLSVGWVRSGDPSVQFDGFQWYTQRGGANTRPSWYRVGELYISGR